MSNVKAARDELRAVVGWIHERARAVNFPGELGPMIAGGCLDTALEHQTAILVLAEEELYGSAHTLLRPEIEALVRGMWCGRCASPQQIERFRAEDRAPKFRVMVEDIERVLGHQRAALLRMHNLHWEALCSFAHTGFQQIARRYTEGQLKPNYSDNDCIRTLGFAGAAGLLAAIELAALSDDREAEQAATEQAREFADRFKNARSE